ncbi:MAG: hypothetical protein JWN44_5761 [Myxococcales bacterium]|nr:hypothetical protein [Myxococcales bacterium]
MTPPTTIDLLGRLDAVVFEAVPATLQLTFAAGAGLTRLGFAAEDWVTDPQFLVKRLHPDERESVLALLQAVALDGKPRNLEHRMVSADGGERWFRTEAHALAGEDAAATRLMALMIDVTEVRRTAEALRDAEARLRQVVNNAPLVLFALDRHGTFTLAEGSGLKGLGLTSSQTVGRSVFDGYRDEPGILASVRRALGGESFTAYDQVLRLGSSWETRWTPIFDSAGRPAGATAVALNVTEAKRAADASRMSMSLLRATLEATTDGILVVDSGGRIVDYNRRFVDLWHIPPDVLASRDDTRFLQHVIEQLRDPDGFLAKVRALYADPDAPSHDVIEFRDGRIYERDSKPQRVDDKSVGRVWSFRDVTAERRATRRATFLAAASKVLAGPLGDATPLDVVARLSVPFLADWCTILLVEDDGTVSSAAAFHSDSACTPLVRRLFPDMRLTDRGIARVLTTGEPVVYNGITDEQLAGTIEMDIVSPTVRGQLDILRQLNLRGYMAVPLRARGKTIGAIAFSRSDAHRRFDDEDVTLATDLAQRAALSIENQRLYRSSQEAVELREEFLSVASHELRTPVTSLQLAVQSLLAIGDDADAGLLRQALESAERQTRRLGRLVDSLLDVSRIQAGRLELARDPIDLVAVARDVASLLVADARRAGCTIDITADEEPLVGLWDRARLEQVVTNLFSNAIKYGAGAPITVNLRRDGNQARLEVRDLGIGIAPAERERIFERFERAVSAKHYGGLGLGLYIVRRIVDAHGGRITVDSSPGTGSVFVVELPLTER